MPMSNDFKKRLFPNLESIADHFGTPFHIYDEIGIRKTAEELKKMFSNIDEFREFFAVKALPNPDILKIMFEMGFGFDCSSIPELIISRRVGGKPKDLMFTSNNTSLEEFEVAMAHGGSIINLDDISLIDKMPSIPELICFRYNPGQGRSGNQLIGRPEEAKYGVSNSQLINAYSTAKKLGSKRFGLHTMLVSNELETTFMVDTVNMLLERIKKISEALNIEFEFINMGGGLGIPYKPEDSSFDIASMADQISDKLFQFKNEMGYMPKLFMESGRYMTGPHGVLVSKVINRKETYRTYIGVDSCMADLMRPAIYGAYHHITVLGKTGNDKDKVDVVGSLCENNDKFAIQRFLPRMEEGNLICIHDTGAHGHAMGFNYNGKLRHMELLLQRDGSVKLIRRNEQLEDYFATLNFTRDLLSAENMVGQT